LAQNFTRKCNLKELVNQDNNFQQMIIHLPVKNDNEKYLKYLIEDLEADVDVNATDKDLSLRTPLLSIMLL